MTTVGSIFAFVSLSQTITTAAAARRATAPSPPPMIAPIGSSSLLEVMEVLSGVALASDPLVEAVFFASEGEIGDVDDGLEWMNQTFM